MQSSWLDARLIDSSGRQKAYKKRQHMSFGATLQSHGAQTRICFSSCQNECSSSCRPRWTTKTGPRDGNTNSPTAKTVADHQCCDAVDRCCCDEPGQRLQKWAHRNTPTNVKGGSETEQADQQQARLAVTILLHRFIGRSPGADPGEARHDPEPAKAQWRPRQQRQWCQHPLRWPVGSRHPWRIVLPRHATMSLPGRR